MNIKFKTYNCIAQGTYYDNGRKAIQLIDTEDGQPIATASVNIVKADCPDDCIYVKDYSENEGMSNALNIAGIIEVTPIDMVESGYVTIGLYKLTDKALKELWEKTNYET